MKTPSAYIGYDLRGNASAERSGIQKSVTKKIETEFTRGSYLNQLIDQSDLVQRQASMQVRADAYVSARFDDFSSSGNPVPVQRMTWIGGENDQQEIVMDWNQLTLEEAQYLLHCVHDGSAAASDEEYWSLKQIINSYYLQEELAQQQYGKEEYEDDYGEQAPEEEEQEGESLLSSSNHLTQTEITSFFQVNKMPSVKNKVINKWKPQRFTQSHLEAKPGRKKKPFLGVDYFTHKDQAKKSVRKMNAAKKKNKDEHDAFKKSWREGQIQYTSGKAGTGQDEMLSTATAYHIYDELQKAGYDEGVCGKALELMSYPRIETSQLVYTTKDQESPIAGHPGALTKNQDDAREGITTDHGSKDHARAKTLIAIWDQLKKPDLSNWREVIVNHLIPQAFIETYQHFTSPGKALKSQDVSGAQDTYSTKYGWVIVDQQMTDRFEFLAHAVDQSRDYLVYRIAETIHEHNLDIDSLYFEEKELRLLVEEKLNSGIFEMALEESNSNEQPYN